VGQNSQLSSPFGQNELPGQSTKVQPVQLRVNAPQVIHETIDNEVVIINLATGSYYSLADTAEEIWSLLLDGVASDEISAILLTRHQGDPKEVSTSVSEFVAELCSEDLMVPNPDGQPDQVAPHANSHSPSPFRPPHLERFSEMQHLIALDPIHEVDEGQGWPHT
jgi:Coenzyme PQQ synthesis protein D (PqqD)